MIEVLKQALKKIATVNAMDYEYQRWAREALAIAELESQEPFGYWNATDGWVTLSQEEGSNQVKTAPKWPLKYKWVTGRGYVVWRDVFEGNMKCSLDEAVTSHTQAVFVDEADAKDYCNFKNTHPPQRTEQRDDHA
jgi:hypothetical protein